MKPRYVVSSVTGWAIAPTGTTTGAEPHTIWSVLDSAYCYRPMTSVVNRRSQYDSPTTSYGPQGERNMRALAARLNALDLLGPPPLPALCAGNGR